LFTPAEPAMGNFASLVGATLVLDAAEKWACLIRYCNNATVVILRTTASRQKRPVASTLLLGSHPGAMTRGLAPPLAAFADQAPRI
jgi:hypothetical protein